MNDRKRKALNYKYIAFVLQLPDPISGEPATDPHHADVVGREKCRNDFYVLPLTRVHHNLWHNNPAEFRRRLDMDIQDLIIYLQSLHIRSLQTPSDYNIMEDEQMGFREYRRGLYGSR